MKITFFAGLLFCFTACFAQPETETFFGKGSRVCFVGNSITNNGEFHHNILLYHITRFPEQPVSFYNCGISGDNTSGVLNRMEDDILVHQPTHVVVMLGMNDVNRSLYGPKATDNADTLRRREEAISTYKLNLEKIINLFLSKNIKVILQKPTIYDQTGVLSAANNLGVNDALKHCADFITTLAGKYKLPAVDYWTILNQVNQQMQKMDPAATITGPDRVHPASPGHLIMAYQFLKSGGAPQYVSKISIGKNAKSLNCEISSVSKRKNEVAFTVKENALPFPVTENQQKGIELVPFTNGLNLEILSVSGLKPGQYQLSIDGEKICIFSEVQLKEGINLAAHKNTPQYYQALRVRDKLTELWQMEAALRALKFIEYNPYFKNAPDKNNMVSLKTYLDSIFTVKYSNPYYTTQLTKYFENKPKQKEYEEKSEMLRQEVYLMARPSEHRFRITEIEE